MAGFWQSLFGSTTKSESGTSIDLDTQTFKLKRGDFCRVIRSLPGLKRGTEVMVSSVYDDERHCRVVDFGRRYHKVHETNLDKI